jgi:PAS domain S-box-containing protein
LKALLGFANYANLALLLANAKASHLWMETYPDIDHESHPIVRKNYLTLIRNEPQLTQIFLHHRDPVERELLNPNSMGGALEGEEHYREIFENASEIIYTHDFNGKLISINRAIERITGYTREDMLQMKFTDVIAPEYSQVGQKMLDPQVAGEIPLSCELEIFPRMEAALLWASAPDPFSRAGKLSQCRELRVISPSTKKPKWS